MPSISNGKQVARILYKEIKGGDVRKILATSNDSDSGGGARDFRFRRFDDLLPVLKRMFPSIVQEERKRDGVITLTDIFKGRFYWHNARNGQIMSKDSLFEGPTDARRNEGRIPLVHEYGCFDTALLPQGGGEGNRIILLLIQNYDGEVWPHYIEEISLRTPGAWDPSVAGQILKCLDAVRPHGHAAIGFYDFAISSRFCNGK